MSLEFYCTLVITGAPDEVRDCLASMGSPGPERVNEDPGLALREENERQWAEQEEAALAERERQWFAREEASGRTRIRAAQGESGSPVSQEKVMVHVVDGAFRCVDAHEVVLLTRAEMIACAAFMGPVPPRLQAWRNAQWERARQRDARLFDFSRMIPGYRGPGALGVTVERDLDGGGAHVRFCVRHYPPEAVIDTLADQFPNLEFDFTYFEPMNEVGGRARRVPGSAWEPVALGWGSMSAPWVN